jgi:hypothetical protein
MGAQRFEADLERHGAGTVLRAPFDPVAEFGRVRAPVRVRINGFEFRTTLMRYGGVDYMGLNREVRDGAGSRPPANAWRSRSSSTTSREWSSCRMISRGLCGVRRTRATHSNA